LVLAIVMVVMLGGWMAGGDLLDLPVMADDPTTPGESPTTPPPPIQTPTWDTTTSGSVSFAFVGDITFGRARQRPPRGSGTIFDRVRGALQADITMGNLETAIGNMGASKCSPGSTSCYTFVAHPDAAQALADAGFDIMTVANNHSRDAGESGVLSTQRFLKEAGVKWTGNPGQITYIDVEEEGIRVGFLGFAPYWSVANALDIQNAKKMVAQAKKNADLVVVFFHLGAEGTGSQHVRPGTEHAFGENRGDPMAFSRAVIDSGADLVVGSGPHVLRGMQWYKGKLIAYSLGNFSGFNTLSHSGALGVSAILHVTLDKKGQFVVGSVTPVVMVSPGFPRIDPKGTAINSMSRLSQQDFGGKGAVSLARNGTINPPK